MSLRETVITITTLPSLISSEEVLILEQVLSVVTQVQSSIPFPNSSPHFPRDILSLSSRELQEGRKLEGQCSVLQGV